MLKLYLIVRSLNCIFGLIFSLEGTILPKNLLKIINQNEEYSWTHFLFPLLAVLRLKLGFDWESRLGLDLGLVL